MPNVSDVKVEQEDREAAVKLYRSRDFESLARAIGKPPANRLAEAFARHRLAAYERCAKAVENNFSTTITREIADSIRKLSE